MPLDIPHHATDIQFLNTPPALMSPPQSRQPDATAVYPDFLRQGAMWAEVSVAKAKITELAAMPGNWDGYGALRISQEAEQNAIKAIEVLLRRAPVPDIVPNPNGTISFEWESNQGVGHLEVGKTRFSFYVKPRSGSPALADGQAEQIGSDLGQLVASLLFPVQHAANTMTKIIIPGNVRFAY